MIYGNRHKKIMLVLGDFIFFYLSLFLTLFIRHLSFLDKNIIKEHFFPFSLIYILWILIFYIAGFYDTEKKIKWNIINIARTLVVGGLLAISLFYFIPSLGITPKTTLILNILVASAVLWGWRTIFTSIAIKSTKIKLAIMGESREKSNLIEHIGAVRHLGYEITKDLSNAEIILVPEEIKKDIKTAKILYNMILSGKTVLSFENFYESLTGKVPVSLISETWFLENLAEINKHAMEKFKRFFDIILAIFLLIPLAIIYLPTAIAIKINNRGPVFFKQKRIGKNRKIFEIIKFRSMCETKNSEKEGWEKPKENDERTTCIGNFLRKTRIDELPQAWNMLIGDISFIGPRPERPEFVKELEKQVPYYSIRHIIKPGLTGWAQINFGDASAKDAMEKLQYDLFYIKNRSAVLDTAIFLKTIMVLLQHSGR
jgi:lipopolysaccharide/colanic/teichoic acid biosynthesis glycosyltransferase